jgi:predicted secreted protein
MPLKSAYSIEVATEEDVKKIKNDNLEIQIYGYGENSDENLINVLTSARQTDTIGLAEMVTGLTVELSAINPAAISTMRDALKAAAKAAVN